MKKSNTLKNKMYEAIFSDIINGSYSSDFILTEKYLIEKYECSRAPIREALTQLTTMGVVSSIPRHGYRINHPDREQLMEIMKMRAVMEGNFLESFGLCIGLHEGGNYYQCMGINAKICYSCFRQKGDEVYV